MACNRTSKNDDFADGRMTSRKKSYKNILDTYIISLIDIFRDTTDIFEKEIRRNYVRKWIKWKYQMEKN